MTELNCLLAEQVLPQCELLSGKEALIVETAMDASVTEATGQTDHLESIDAERGNFERDITVLATQLSARFNEISTLTRLLLKSEKVAERAKVRAVKAEAERQRFISELGALSARLSASLHEAKLSKSLLDAEKSKTEAERRKNMRLVANAEILCKVIQMVKPSKAVLREVTKRGLVDPEKYLKNNPDVAEVKYDPVLHFLIHGASEGRDSFSNGVSSNAFD
ncbi:hypothetical protein RI570_16925 [Brucella pseudogrignonensis]|uniref:hypothetical protein n=1 Tax=Brucella pseudogrignonensis TaxID=419475 RepID=UPI0028B60D8B|nr:hypothetical protein [Brucella pseudogrignonensis]MDT6941793.1 hypothetical protein [Brucella pseudogrignonensis]